MLSILLVNEDLNENRKYIKRLENHYLVYTVLNGKQALDYLDHRHIDLIITELLMKPVNGIELTSTLRESGYDLPIIMISPTSNKLYKKRAYQAGVDDYILKDIDLDELVWKIEAIARRSHIVSQSQLNIGELQMDSKRLEVKYHDKVISVTNKEFNLLYKLCSYPNQVFTKQQIMDEIWGYDTTSEYDTIKTYISRLRNKFASYPEFKLVSIRNQGYKVIIKNKRDD